MIHPLPEDISPTEIYHLASPASVPDYQRLPEETALVNSVGTRHLLQLAKKTGASFLFASTSEVYGDPLEHPQKETYWGNVNPNGIRACYDESKRYGEMMTMLYHRRDHVNTRIIRIFNTYGPRMRPTDGRVISNFLNQAIRNQPITLYGSGEQTRSFCFVSDLVDGIRKVMQKGSTGSLYNLGNPDEYTMNELAKQIVSLTQTQSVLEHKPLPQDDPKQRCPDISLAKQDLGWDPRVPLVDGLKKTVSYYQSLL